MSTVRTPNNGTHRDWVGILPRHERPRLVLDEGLDLSVEPGDLEGPHLVTRDDVRGVLTAHVLRDVVLKHDG